MKKKTLICIGCPRGCKINVVLDKNKIVSIKGNACAIGYNYAKKECTNPTRIVTSVIKVNNGNIPMVPCKTEKDIPKDLIFDVLNLLKGLSLEAPILIGDVLLENVCNTGVNIISTRTVNTNK